MTRSVVGPRRNSRALPRAKLAPKKVMVTIWWSVGGLIHYSFLDLGETITSEQYAQHIDEMTENCNACSWHWSTERAQFFSIHDDTWLNVTQPKLQKLNELPYEVLPHLPYFPSLSSTDYHFFKHLNNFCRVNISTNRECRKCSPGVHRIAKHRFLHYRNKQTCFSLAKMYDFNGSYFD